MNNLQIRSNMTKAASGLGDAELGRLFRGMLQYAFLGEAPEFTGAEKVLWPTFMEDIDKQEKAYQRKATGAAKARSLISARHQSDTCQRSDGYQAEKREEDKREEKKKECPSSPLKPPFIPQIRKSEGITEEEAKRAHTKKSFIPPTLEDVRAYVAQRNSIVDPVEFWEYYNEGHWVDSEGKPVNAWKQKLLTWEHHQKGQPRNGKARGAQDLDSTYEMMRRWADE